MVKRSSLLAAVITLFVAGIAIAACSKRESRTADDEDFATTIEPLVRAKCQTCHREGGIAPFPLVTYDEMRAVGRVARDAVVRREMPPWGPFDDDACVNVHRFKGDLSLSEEQIATFVRWVDGGMPRGDTSKIPPPATFSPLGLVDKTHTFEIAAPHVVQAGGRDELRCFPIDPGLHEDTWIGESIMIPADPRVVHHALVYLDPHREGVTKTDSSGSYPCFGTAEVKDASLLLAWSPGGTSTTYGEDAGLKVAKDAHLVIQMHYHPIGSSTTGRASLELKKLPRKPAHAAWFVLLGGGDSADKLVKLLPGPSDPETGPAFLIPSDTKGHVETLEFVNPVRWKVSAVGPHMHWAGVDMKIELERKAAVVGDPESACLLGTKYDFDWQRTYAYDAPLAELPSLNEGDRLRIICTYDNTADNRHIARVMHERRMTKPPAIRYGSSSTDEMCQAIVVFVE